MRFLNKIIFINSASIPYAEIQLDGNIHFIGTQGVGKSTILRAILYFYNADSRKLGLPKGPSAKSFVDWYLGYGNSYLIYEVARETGPYCILAYKSQNRVSYRFLDTAYNPAYFVNPSSNEVYQNWETIRSKLDANRVNVSTMVNSFDDYRNILYGNFTDKNEFKKYALLEAKQYNNIYRTIQNVFLNTKLDATEIKQTIISSMEDEEIKIDLEKYNHHLKGFETELEDIKQFRRSFVIKQAQNAMQMLSAIRHLNREQSSFIAQLKWRLGVMENEKPILIGHQEEFKKELDKLQQNRFRELNLFQTRKEKINDTISLSNGKLKEIVKQKDYYKSINIEELIKRVSAHSDKKQELENLTREQSLLTNEFIDINSRYETLIRESENQISAFHNQKQNQKIEIEKAELQTLSGLNTEYEILLATIEQEHELEVHTKQELATQKTEAWHHLEKKMVAVKHERFFGQEIQDLHKRRDEAATDHKRESNNVEHLKQQIANLQTKWEYEKADVEREMAQEQEKLQLHLERSKKSKNVLVKKINKSNDSFYGWLNEHRTGWQDNIGKVVDENLLFKVGLSPKIEEGSNLLFGVQINLDELECGIKSLDDYRFELEKLEGDLLQQQKAIHDLSGTLENELEKVQRRNLPKLKELKEKLRQSEYRIEQLYKNQELLFLEIEELERKAKVEKQQAIEKLQEEIEGMALLKQDAVVELEACRAKLKRNKETKQREKTKRINELREINKMAIAEIDQQVKERSEDIALQIDSLKAERNRDMDSKGVDTERLSSIDNAIVLVKEDLNFIEKKNRFVFEYEKDKRELFDKEKEFKHGKKMAEDKLEQLQAELDLTLKKLDEKINSSKADIQEMGNKIQRILDDESKYEEFMKSSVYLAIANYLDTAVPMENVRIGIQLIDEINRVFYTQKDKQDELKTSIDRFLSYFSETNIFKFPSKLLGTEEYLRWAEELNDFIEEGKIDQFEKRSNERFASIISAVGKETTTLISKTGEIKKIINKINADFKQKNFVSAVTNIELDITDSKNTAVMILRKIKEFNDEHAFNIGAANLFSVDDHDKTNEKAVSLLKHLVKETHTIKDKTIKLSDSFELSFRVEENGNDTGWVEKLSSVGSEGTDVLVKAMINIMLLNVFKEGASRKFKDFKLHCMMDEIGKLHPINVKGILKFANDRNIMLINGSPTESTPLNYRHIYKIHKDEHKQSKVKRIISNPVLID